MNVAFVENFKKLKHIDERNFLSIQEKHLKDLTLIDYLQTALKNNELKETEEKGFAYWNISDSFAMLRDSKALYKNHCEFAKFLSEKPSKYLLWLACDATQRFTLELDGFGDFWWNCYKTAISKNTTIKAIEPITFECHNAALSVTPTLKTPTEYLQFAKNNFKAFLKSSETSDNYIFYKTVYAALCLKAFGQEEFDVFELGTQLLPWLHLDNAPNDLLIGEWERLNGQRSKYNMATVAINRIVNAFIDRNQTKYAKELYDKAINYGMSKNLYIEKRISI